MKFLKTISLITFSLLVQVAVAMNPAFWSATAVPHTAGGGGGGGGWTLIGSGVAASSADTTAVTTGSYNTTGASFLVVIEENNNSSPTPTDSKGNTWVKAVSSISFAGEQSSIWYCSSPTTDAAQTFSVSGATPSIAVYAFSGGSGGILDQSNSGFNNGSATMVQPGSITPTTSNQLIITGVAFFVGTTATVDSGFSTPLKSGATGTAFGVGASFLVQNPAAAINPTWTTSLGDDTATSASFK